MIMTIKTKVMTMSQLSFTRLPPRKFIDIKSANQSQI